MNNTEMTPQKLEHRNGSLERKLVFSQVKRIFFTLLSLDIWIIVLFFAGMIIYYEHMAEDILQHPGAEIPPQAGYVVEESTGYQPGWIIFTDIARKIGQESVVRNLWTDTRFDYRPAQALEGLHYSISVPADPFGDSLVSNWDRTYYRITFSLREPVVIFEYAFLFLLAIELLSLFAAIFKIRRSVRRSLRPIYDLTMIAESMNRNAHPAVALTPTEELHLSGAIDTLNTITENDLDRRIIIADERQELRGLAQAINAMLDRLDAAYRSQLRFVSDASHELRTPIAVIQGYANLLDRWGKNDEVTLQESIDAIKIEAANMQNLVEQLLFLARSDNRSIVLSVENVNICELADEVLRETQMIDQQHEYASDLTRELRVRGDAQLLKQAMRIFIDNAIKYTPPGGKITISVRTEEDYAKISVSDTGIGIPADDLAHVFDRFFRADESRARGTGGTGLGLSIAKWIVDRHGGFVEIISREDIGTKVTVALPETAAGSPPEPLAVAQ